MTTHQLEIEAKQSANHPAFGLQDSTPLVELRQLSQQQINSSNYRIVQGSTATFYVRQIDGESWASWEQEHAAADTADQAMKTLWEQLGKYLDSLVADEAALSPSLARDLAALRGMIERR